MAIEMTPTHIATIRPDHTITLPTEMPIGAKVMIIVMPDESAKVDERARQERFAKTLEAIRVAMKMPLPKISDAKLNALVDKARKSPAS
jgi:hypothetical protein